LLFEAPLRQAVFAARPNRFLGEVEIDGGRANCYIPNPGRMEELLRPGAEVYIIEKGSESRKTRWDLVAARHGGVLVSIDSRVPNAVVSEAVEAGSIPEFGGLRLARREPTVGESRLDFLLEGDAGSLYLEVKSCTLVREGTGFFPDAPTKRGSRHLRKLMGLLGEGRTALFFLVQRSDAHSLRPNRATDPVFADTLMEAAHVGVEIYAYNSVVTLDGVYLGERVAVELI
jgi:sugar fermentation stimulation protein A